jgi:hypothetical protein
MCDGFKFRDFGYNQLKALPIGVFDENRNVEFMFALSIEFVLDEQVMMWFLSSH